MEKKLSDFTTVELKALAYDAFLSIQIGQTNLKIINEELDRRNVVPATPPSAPTNPEPNPYYKGEIETI